MIATDIKPVDVFRGEIETDLRNALVLALDSLGGCAARYAVDFAAVKRRPGHALLHERLCKSLSRLRSAARGVYAAIVALDLAEAVPTCPLTLGPLMTEAENYGRRCANCRCGRQMAESAELEAYARAFAAGQ